MKKRSAHAGGPLHVQIIKAKRLSADLPNRLNDYKHQFPARRIVAVAVPPPLVPSADVLYEVIWEDIPK